MGSRPVYLLQISLAVLFFAPNAYAINISVTGTGTVELMGMEYKPSSIPSCTSACTRLGTRDEGMA